MYHTGQNAGCIEPSDYYQRKYNDFLNAVLPRLACPSCSNSVGITRHGDYLRQFYISDTEHFTVRVTRMRCHSCSRTFVLLPSQLVPYKRYVLRTILTAIKSLYRKTRYQVERLTGITAKLLKYWQQQFVRWHAMLYEAHDLESYENHERIALEYNILRPKRRLMQIISAWTQPFHSIF